jgi:hypothetical protein
MAVLRLELLHSGCKNCEMAGDDGITSLFVEAVFRRLKRVTWVSAKLRKKQFATRMGEKG